MADSPWRQIVTGDPSTLPTEADASEDRTVWVRRRNGNIISVEYDVFGFRRECSSGWEFVEWHPKPKQSPPTYTPPEQVKRDRRKLTAFIREVVERTTHPPQYEFVAYSPSPDDGWLPSDITVRDGFEFMEHRPGDMDPDAAIRLRNKVEKFIETLDSPCSRFVEIEARNALREASIMRSPA